MSRVMLPVPPSANQMYRVARNRQYRSKAYMDWLDIAADALSRNVKPFDAPVSVRVTLVMGKGITVRADLDNLLKPVMDALKPCTRAKETNQITKPGAGVIPDDSLEYVKEIAATWEPPATKKDAAFILVDITPA